jgi:hypothetical protein
MKMSKQGKNEGNKLERNNNKVEYKQEKYGGVSDNATFVTYSYNVEFKSARTMLDFLFLRVCLLDLMVRTS